MSDNYRKPHDKRNKEVFRNKKAFLSLLKDHINEPWTKDLNEDSLRLSNKTFILQDFSEKEADVVYEAEINGTKIIFYILLEIQSTVDYRMSYRLILYIVEILRDYYNNADPKLRKRKNFKFPVVIPIVYYCGSRRWTVPLNVKEMFEAPEMFGKYVMNLEYMLVNANSFDENELEKLSSRVLAMIILLEQSKSEEEFFGNLQLSLAESAKFDNEERRIYDLFIKIIVKAHKYKNVEEIAKLINEDRVKEADSMLCDLAKNIKKERKLLFAKGREEGIKIGEEIGEEKGIKIGEEKGKKKSYAEIAKTLNISSSKFNELLDSGKLARIIESLDYKPTT